MTIPEDKRQLWFGKGPEQDQLLEDEFGPFYCRVTGEESRDRVEQTTNNLRRRLSLVILLDQVSRNLFRSQPEAFQQDDWARKRAGEMIDRREDSLLIPIERAFLYKPFQHSERLIDQKQNVFLYRRLLKESPPEWESYAEKFLDYAREHYQVFERFGRFPHRNSILGRESTTEEIKFNRQPGTGF